MPSRPPRGLLPRQVLGACLALLALLSITHASASTADGGGGGDDTWAVIASGSRYWLNYRHAANALGVYQAVKR